MDYLDDINHVNFMVNDGRLSDIEQMESMNVDAYYSTLNTYLKVNEQKKQ